MQFKYKRTAFGILMPIIPIGIGLDNSYAQYEVLVDSGAAINVFDAQMGELIGLDIPSGKKDWLEVVNGKRTEMYIHEISIEFPNFDYQFKTSVGFIKDCVWPYGLVGQRGFFNQFHIHFDQRKGIVDINPQKEVN